MDQAFEYVKSSGLETLVDYPYVARDEKCKATDGKAVVKISGYKDVAANDPKQLMAAVAKGPVSVAIEADTSVF